jgi:putative membrane protein
VDLALLVALAYFSAFGALLGALTGITPGVHVNTLCLVLLSSLPAILPVASCAALWIGASAESVPFLMACLIVSAAVSHSFLDFLPSIFLGAPDEDEAVSALPGHRLLLQGRGLEAVAHAAHGSLVGGSVAVLLSVFLYFVLGPPLNLYTFVDSFAPVAVVSAILLMVLSERKGTARAEVTVESYDRIPPSLDLARPVPVDGAKAVLQGRVEKDLLGAVIVTATGRWRLRGHVHSGTVRVEGHWRVRACRARGRALAALLILLSGLLGLTVMDGALPFEELSGLDLGLMFPLLTGLFGLPSLLASGQGGVPAQEEPVLRPRTSSGVLGALAGAAVGWFPGITSTAGVVLLTSLDRRSDDPARFITMVSAVGTASAAFGLLALAVAFKGRSGALLAVKEVLGGDALPFDQFPGLLLSVLIGCAIGYLLLLRLGRAFAQRVPRANVPLLNRTLLIMLVALVAAFTGVPGLIVLGTATLLGLVPTSLGVARIHLTGCLLLPVLMYLFGLR